MEPAEVVRRLGGQAKTSEIVRYSGKPALGRAVEAGSVLRVRKGHYVLPRLPTAAQVAERYSGVVSHGSAAMRWNLRTVVDPDVVHVTVPHNFHRRGGAGARLHYADLAPGESDGSVTSPLRTVLDCAATLPFVEALAVADSALDRRLVTASGLLAAAEQRRGRGRARMLRVARFADAKADNPFESALRGIVIEAGMTDFVPQFEITCRGRSYHPDLTDPARRLILEADSFQHHAGRTAFGKDCARYDEFTRAGWTVLRFTWEHVMFEAAWLAQLVLDVRDQRPVLKAKVRETH